MNRLRNRLIAVFIAATVVPLAATWWIATSLLEHSVALSSIGEVDRLSRTLEKAGRELYLRTREALKRDADAGLLEPRRFASSSRDLPPSVREFWESGENERFSLAAVETGTEVMQYLVREPGGVRVYSRGTGAVSLTSLSDQYRRARESVSEAGARDLRGGLVRTFAVLVASVWAISLAILMFLAHRVSRPIQQLTAGLARLAAGDLSTRIPAGGDDETGRAIRAFNETAAELEQSRDRLVYLTQLASWRLLARKMAHELKNSLTPIRLTMEEILARRQENDQEFIEQAARIVVDEVEGLERRVRAFSEFSAEPPVRAASIDLNAAARERIAFLAPAHGSVRYRTRFAVPVPVAEADEDLVKSILTNLLENAAEAAPDVLVVTAGGPGRVAVEIHDSGPGLSEQARQSLFEPTISFKKHGMGLGLSIVRKNALLCGGDVEVIPSELGGAGFRLTLPAAPARARAGDSAGVATAASL